MGKPKSRKEYNKGVTRRRNTDKVLIVRDLLFLLAFVKTMTLTYILVGEVWTCGRHAIWVHIR